MKNLRHALERLMFGATAEEQVEMQQKLTELIVERRVEQRLARLVEALAADEDDEHQDEEPRDSEEGGAA